jgi:beta-galactosidase
VIAWTADLSRYRILVVPPHMTSDEALAAKLRDYVSQGGHLIMGPQSFTRDRHMSWHRVPPPAGLTEVFGADVAEGCFTANYLSGDTSCLGFDATSVSAEPPKHERVPLASSVDGLDRAVALTYISALNVKTASVLATYSCGLFAGLPAITHHRYGAGSATYLGCLLESAALSAVYGHVLRMAGVKATRTTGRRVEVVTLRNHTIYLNHGSEPCREPVAEGQAVIGTIADGFVALDPYGFAVIERAQRLSPAIHDSPHCDFENDVELVGVGEGL